MASENSLKGWKRGYAGLYHFKAEGVLGLVSQEGEHWLSVVYVGKSAETMKEVDRGEWDSRSTALRNAKAGMERACWLRQFDNGAPRMPPKSEPEFPWDDDDDDDDACN